ncbi:hypothetical protein [Jannaschia aquimarina]|uniref:Uncharacterized protein n=1 Tax=Jannaschia aquimarina TaxID=935700 RepID=A0A0D1EMR0_9RHOB|nr:hypothetical protein [Jannaschia aquimarina]KIT16980.1 hypothetical protein jaqu_12930 [Jannaschia aquimarina]SNT33090.1 hypothetical protein SAMN05421775_111109 [Jannaschia aquimarina]
MRLILPLLLAPLPALACEEPIDFPPDEAIVLLEEIRDGADLDLRAQFDYQRLLCADDQFIRDQARAIGRASEVEAIRAAAIRSAIFEKDVLNLTILPADGMSDAAIAMMEANPIISYQVAFVDRAAGCVSLNETARCNPTYLASLSGTEMDLKFNKAVAKLRLTDNGRMVGVWSNGESLGAITQQVELRLD